MVEQLLAKSQHSGIGLLQHTRDVIGAAEALFGAARDSTRLGRCWLHFFKLPANAWPVFHANLLAACALHDWGKANDGFQEEVRGRRQMQAIRHEHLSALLMAHHAVWSWLRAEESLDLPLVLSAVMTHHLKAAFDPLKEWGFARCLNRRPRVRLLHRSNEFKDLVDAASDLLHLGHLDLAQVPEQWAFDKPPASIRDTREDLKNRILIPFHNELDGDTARRRLLYAVRAGLIAADAAGSGLVREGKTVARWIREQFDDAPLWDGERIRSEIIDRRITDLNTQFAAHGKPQFEWSAFQQVCDDLPDRTLLLAPCGSGKTLAAWRWIAARAAERPVGRVLFLYPTRATAKEGFKDYVSWAPEADAALMHGTAEFDLRDMFDNDQDSRHGLSYEADRRLFALGFWQKRAFSATVDQFLAFLQYGYAPVCMLPVLADSIIVVDEVHSFDQKMFSALKVFLKEFDVPVLCMTATLPQDRCEQLEKECGLKPFAEKLGELAVIARMPRYQLRRLPSRDAAEERAREALRQGRRVLWVVNTVARCHEIVERFAANFDPASQADNADLQTAEGRPIYCYHSRFRLFDRVERHNNVVANLKATGPAGLGATTQVCEMSLDLDVDLLITEECPVTSLIQRMGRANRERNARPPGRSGEVIVYRPADQNPYSRDELTGLEEFLSLVAEKEDLSQADLVAALNNKDVPSPPWGGDKLSMFLESGPFAVAGEEDFRDGDERNRQCVLPDEVGAYAAADAKDKPGFLLPVPMRWARCRDDEAHPEHKQLPRYIGVAEAGHYHPAIGYYDRTLDKWRT
jgi:CRISPR-associated endonuclease/helicase Cas3